MSTKKFAKNATSKSSNLNKSSKSVKLNIKEKNLKKEDKKESDEENSGEEIEEVDDGDEEFFNQDSYESFAKKNDIEKISSSYHINNDLHKVDVIISKDLRRTSEIMSYAEFARVISERAKQIENGSPIFIKLMNKHNPIDIAEEEVRQKKCPLKVVRYLTKNIKEEWSVNEMIIPFGINSDKK